MCTSRTDNKGAKNTFWESVLTSGFATVASVASTIRF
jgi:hypothetical protein